MAPTHRETATTDALARQLFDAAAEERQHLFREGLTSVLIGFAGCAFLILVIPLLAHVPVSRRMGMVRLAEWSTIIAAIVALLLIGSIIWSWRWLRPLRARLPSSRDPRFGPPQAREGIAEEVPDPLDLTCGDWWVVREMLLWEQVVTVGARQIVLGITSFAERSRLSAGRLRLAASLLRRAAIAPGMPSVELPTDIETLLALTFLWRYRYIQADGLLTKRRLVPTPKGRDALSRAGAAER